MKKTLTSFADTLSGAPIKEYHSKEEKSTLELTEQEKRIVLKFIRRLGILFNIEGIILCVALFVLALAALFFGIPFLFSLFS